MAELLVVAHWTIAAGAEEEVRALLPEFIEASRGEPGCLSFVGYQQLDDDRTVVLLERYASREAFEAHRDTPHFQRLALEQIVPRLARRVVQTYDVPG
ncbi:MULTISPECIES: putative quinol monooxygenase [unclassified Plantactinospora]|uniref:putative quinol monooxygenase n=1 Tax=unclassified Plantactinospora TaxID=2631981 RepID=UPI000D17BE43|nr:MULTISPECIES: antibiotic biosynthesis monooxygenase family protein [unclassified Plantactinospora]AVT28617.1 antibiotic biosynthesis monooxygenase [Plantactinospora sp. BC1]AVT38143.1 antibiotic biosynthesis monooxygenase [Plantactinospora sp. BB1]